MKYSHFIQKRSSKPGEYNPNRDGEHYHLPDIYNSLLSRAEQYWALLAQKEFPLELEPRVTGKCGVESGSAIRIE